MNKKYNFRIFTVLVLVLFASNSFARGINQREDMGFLYGVGGSLALISDAKDELTADPTFGASAILGLEDKNWALEAVLTRTADANLDNGKLYSMQSRDIGIAYRSNKRRNFYFKLKVSKMDIDIKDLTTNSTDGLAYTFGLGYLLTNGQRIELDYSYYNIDDTNYKNMHLFSLRYIWGGSTKGRN